MKIFGNTDKKHIRLAAAVLTASIVLSMSSMTGCAASGTSGGSENARTEETEEEAGQAAAQGVTGFDDTVAETDGSSAETDGSSADKAAEREEAAGAAAAEAVKQGAVSGDAAAETVKQGAESDNNPAEAVKQEAESGDNGEDHSEEASSGMSYVKAASESGEGTSGSSGPEEEKEADRKSASGGKEEEIPEKPTVREDGGVSMNVFAMDTYMTLLAYGDQAEKAVLAAAKEIHELDDMLSTGIETSEICRINAAGSGEISGDVETLIDKSLELYDKTDGLFNIAIYPVMKVWGFPTQEFRVPSGKEIEKALKLADVPAIELITEADMKKAQKAAAAAAEEVEKAQEAADQAAKQAADRKKAAEEKKKAGSAAEGKTGQDQISKEQADAEAADKSAAEALKSAKEKLAAIKVPSAPSVSFKTKGMEIDLGGIAKGYTGDRVGEVFSRYRISSGIISLGGNVQAFGSKINGKPWRVAVQNPESSMEYLGVLDVENKAVVTSGGYERYFEENGVRYHHIIDPRTGYPADSGLISATIVCDQGILADGLSTSLFIMGKDQAEKFWRESSWNFDYILEDKEGTLYVTEGIADSLTTDANVVIVNRYVEETVQEKKKNKKKD